MGATAVRVAAILCIHCHGTEDRRLVVFLVLIAAIQEVAGGNRQFPAKLWRITGYRRDDEVAWPVIDKSLEWIADKVGVIECRNAVNVNGMVWIENQFKVIVRVDAILCLCVKGFGTQTKYGKHAYI